MTTILVVDDSKVDRRLVAGLLQKDGGVRIQECENGTAALEKMIGETPDLVVTDLMMPGMDGLELVEKVRDSFPLVPVILMTSRGNEEIAVMALKKGAASYVPKGSLARDLLETVEGVLSVSGERRTQAELLDCLTVNDCAFVLENNPRLVPALIRYVQEKGSELRLWDETTIIQVGVALEEVLVNAIHHGNLEVSSELREEDHREYYKLVETRAQESPYRERMVHVRATLSRNEGRFVIRDEGPGFDWAAAPDPTHPTNLDKVSGRGLLLMRTFMDRVEFNEIGNEVTLVKRVQSRGFRPPQPG